MVQNKGLYVYLRCTASTSPVTGGSSEINSARSRCKILTCLPNASTGVAGGVMQSFRISVYVQTAKVLNGISKETLMDGHVGNLPEG